MISNSGKSNFFVANYDKLVAAIGILALVAGGVFFAMDLGLDADEAAGEERGRIARMKPAKSGVEAVDLTALQATTRLVRNPTRVSEVADRSANFMTSERRVKCKKCSVAIPGDTARFPKCPACGEPQEVEKPIVLDADGDGMPDDWEKLNALNPHNPADAALDSDGDGFTNLEEFMAKTDPKIKTDHPDYLDSVKLILPLKETYLPFVFTKATKIPSGWRCEFFDARQKDDYGRMGKTFTATIGGEIGKSGFVLKGYEPKTAKREKKGMKGMMVTVDVSEATVVRQRDGKALTLVLARSKKEKPLPVDVQATLSYERGATSKTLEVTPGETIELNGTKYKVVEIAPAGKGAKVVFENGISGKKRTLETP